MIKMKTLDKYIVKTFLSTAAWLFMAMMGLRIVLDLLLNMDEFTVNAKSTFEVLKYAMMYYSDHSLIYLVEIGGIIIVSAAVFSLVRMQHTNELTAMLASGVSLHRVVWPIIICSMILSSLLIIDQEVFIPRVAHRLVMDRDQLADDSKTEFRVPAMTDNTLAVWYSPHFVAQKETMDLPIALIRDNSLLPMGCIKGDVATYDHVSDGWRIRNASIVKINYPDTVIWPRNPGSTAIWTNLSPHELIIRSQQNPDGEQPVKSFTGIIDPIFGFELQAKRFVPDPYQQGKPRSGTLENPRMIFKTRSGLMLGTFEAQSAVWNPNPDGTSPEGYWQLIDGSLIRKSDLEPSNMILRQSSNWMNFMSTAELISLLKMKQVSDERTAMLTLHIRVTGMINNLVMLLLGVPFILSRQRNLKTSIGLCLLTVAGFYVFVHGCRFMPGDPLWAAWLPIIIFGPIAIVMLDSIKT